MSIWWLIANLAAREPNAIGIVAPRGFQAASVLLDLDAQTDERLVLGSIGHHESRYNPYALGKDGDCGETQVVNPELWGSSCKKILGNRTESYRVSLIILRASRQSCPGTWARVLTMYASGKCGVAPYKARELCAPTGLCDLPYINEAA